MANEMLERFAGHMRDATLEFGMLAGFNTHLQRMLNKALTDLRDGTECDYCKFNGCETTHEACTGYCKECEIECECQGCDNGSKWQYVAWEEPPAEN